MRCTWERFLIVFFVTLVVNQEETKLLISAVTCRSVCMNTHRGGFNQKIPSDWHRWLASCDYGWICSRNVTSWPDLLFTLPSPLSSQYEAWFGGSSTYCNFIRNTKEMFRQLTIQWGLSDSLFRRSFISVIGLVVLLQTLRWESAADN